jgi:hypothetical protein
MRPRIPWPFGHVLTLGRRVRRTLGTRLFADLTLLGLVAFTLCAWWYSLRWGFRHDGPVVMYPAHLMRTGQRVLYRDLIDMNQPMTFLVMGILDWLCGTDDRALRIADVAVLAATCMLTADAFAMSRRLMGWAASAPYALFHLHDAGVDALQREIWLILFVVASGAAMRHRRFALAGVLAGMAFFVKFQAILFVLVLLAGHVDPAVKWRQCARWLAGAASAAAVLVGGLAVFGAADDWWWLARNYLPLYADLSGALGFETDTWVQWEERVRCVLFAGDRQLLWVFPFAFWLMVSTQRRHRSSRSAVMAACFFFVAWLYPMPSGTFWTYHYSPQFFATGVVFAIILGASLREMHASRIERLAMVCLALYVGGTQMRPWWQDAERNATNPGVNRAARDIAGYISSHVEPGESVQPLDTVVGVVEGMWRADARLATSFQYQFMFFHHPQSATTQTLRRRFLRELDEARPALVIRAAGLPGLAGGTASTQRFDELEDLLSRHYEQEYATGSFTYLRRIEPWVD